MRESRLITLLQQQKPEGLQALMTTYQAYIGTIIRNITRNTLHEQDVEELTADTFLAVWQTADKLQTGKVRSYLAAIARNKAKSRLRTAQEVLPLEEEAFLLETADLEQTVEHTLLAEALQDTLQALSENDRDVLIRYYYYYQHVPEIAAELHLSTAAVKVRLHRARKKLKQLLMERGYVYETKSI
ncbi:MAG: sigma-70 family RNA polymerase sigma factor [Oscillospiraceae bacterium]|nr:sigma-70 family RNA polymerase sigma factor [Oscillospiraceae bacterium]